MNRFAPIVCLALAANFAAAQTSELVLTSTNAPTAFVVRGGQIIRQFARSSTTDGATDGLRNWTISHNDFSNNFAVLVGDADWNNMQISFVPVRRS